MATILFPDESWYLFGIYEKGKKMWEAFKDFIFWVIQAFYNICGDWGLAIIIITLIFRAAITPLMYTQSKSSYNMRKIQPLITQIKERFPDDVQRQNEETQKLYAQAKFNPLAGCVPMLIQMPIFIALFQVLREMSERVSDTTNYVFFHLVPDLTLTPADAFAINVPTFIPYIVLLAIFALCTFIPTLLMQNQSQDPQQKKMTLIMVVVMSIMMIWIGWSSPAGVLLFWGASSIIGVCQQQISMRLMKKRDAEKEETIEVKPIEVDVTRKAKKPRPKKKDTSKKHA